MNRPVDSAKARSQALAAEVAAARAELDALLRQNPKISFVDAVMPDLCGVLRGKRIPVGQAGKLFESGMQIPLSIYLMDAKGEMANPFGRGFGDGDPDGTSWPLAGTATRVWGSDPPRAQIFMTMRDERGEVFAGEPRATLALVASRFDPLGLVPVTALELEFYLLDQTRDHAGRPQPPLCPRTGAREGAVSVYSVDDLDRYQGFVNALNEAAVYQGIPISATSSEYAPGQFEANLMHQKNALRAADHAVLLRQVVRAAAVSQGCHATFMAKPYPDRAGSGLHVHLSLLDKSGRNVFDNGTSEGSELLRFAAGGCAAMMAESMAIFAPNLNSYRRFAPDMFAPVNRRWGVNNRSAGVRVPVGSGEARRIEHRVAGADANPCLVLAAVLAGVHHGIVNKIDAGPPAIGNVSREPDPALPFTLDEALAALEAGKVLREYFGKESLDLYRETKRIEQQRLRKTISDVEYDWYL
ncbi:MAG: glutamine synthetase family protein [Alphaproteobacteria bacterium]